MRLTFDVGKRNFPVPARKMMTVWILGRSGRFPPVAGQVERSFARDLPEELKKLPGPLHAKPRPPLLLRGHNPAPWAVLRRSSSACSRRAFGRASG